MPSAKKFQLTVESRYEGTGGVFPKFLETFKKFPVQIGRTTRATARMVSFSQSLEIRDQTPYNISREHCIIEHAQDHLIIVDANSTLGTEVNGMRIGHHSGIFSTPLEMGENEIQLGSPHSPHHLRFYVEEL